MAKKIDFKKLLPYGAAFLIFLFVTLFFFSPLLEGKVMKQMDVKHHKGMSKEIVDHRKAHDNEEPLWTNSMFGGMPAYQISVRHDSNFLRTIDKAFKLWLPNPASLFFLYLVGFFILLKTLKVDTWLSIVGALAFAFSSYFIIILQAGHNSKAHAIGYMAPVLASIIITFRGRYLAGGIMMALFMGLQLNANHPQITYYLALIVIILGIFEFFDHLKNKQFPHFGKAVGVLLIATMLAFSANISRYWTTAEYSPYTIRGKSELSFDKNNKTSGLDRDYATQWSYGKAESFSFMIPNVKGGASEPLALNDKAMDAVNDPQMKQFIAQNRISSYFGDQPFTSGPVYMGAFVVFLFVLSLFLVKGKYKWALLIATLLALFLSWGKNMMWFTDLFMDYFPAYNKFRAVAMTLVIAELTMVLLAFLGLKEILDNPKILKEKKMYFYLSLGLTAGITLLFALMPDFFFSFLSNNEVTQLHKIQLENPEQALGYQQFFDEIQNGRKAIFMADTWRTFLFILLGAAALFIYSTGKLKKGVLVAIIGVLILADLIPINRRYLNDDHYERNKKKALAYAPTQADLQILQDKDPNYRVFNLTVGNPFSDASTSYFHKSIGGYHGAKLRRYQDLIDHYIAHQDMQVLNMLNAKYFILPDRQSGKPVVKLNQGAMGNAWFVNEPYMVSNPDQELIHLGTVAEVKLLSDNPNALNVYGRNILPTDTILLNADISINNEIKDQANAKLDLSQFPLIPGMEYTFGSNPADTTPNFIDLSRMDKDKVLKPKHFTLKVFYQFDPHQNAIIDNRYADYLSTFKPEAHVGGSIKLSSYDPNHLVYKTQTKAEQLAVFSEIFYEKGWNAYLDGEAVDHIRANYVLRAMVIPAGEHTVEFKFEPKSYKTGSLISAIGSALIILLTIGLIYMSLKDKKEEASTEE